MRVMELTILHHEHQHCRYSKRQRQTADPKKAWVTGGGGNDETSCPAFQL